MRNHGRWENQVGGAQWAVREDLSQQRTHSIMPFDWGWKAVVWMCCGREEKEFQREEVNWVPL
jgi:hypothetical protein